MPDLITLADVPALKGSDAKPRAIIAIGRLDANLRDPRYGKFSISQADVDSWKRNLAGVFGGQVAFDFDHSSDRGNGTRAAAWVRSIDQTGTADGSLITADVQFTKRGARAVRDGDYKYTSPTFVENYTDEHGVKHGKALIGGALTNRPVLRKGMPTLSLSRDSFEGVALATVSPKVRKKTATLKGNGKPEFPMPDAEHAQLALDFVKRSLKAGNITPADAAEIRARANAMLGNKSAAKKTAARDSRAQMSKLDELRKLLDLGDDADAAAVAAAAVTLAAAPPADDADDADADDTPPKGKKATKKANKTPPAADKQTMALDSEGHVLLSQEAYANLLTGSNAGQAAARQLSEQTFDHAWEKALSEGRAAPSQEETVKELYNVNPDLAIKTLDSFVKIVPTKPTGSGDNPNTGPAPAGMDDERYQLHTEAKQLAAKKTSDDPKLGADEAYILAVNEISERQFELENPGI